MSGGAEIRDVILGVVEGAGGGVAALREVDPAARVEDLDVEVSYGAPEEAHLTLSIRFSIVTAGSTAGLPDF
jgi:hypothetical protein